MKRFDKIQPLSNFDINKHCSELEIINFKGVFMRDELINAKANNDESLVINLDVSSGPGIHWMCLFSWNGISYYFDSYGLPPIPEVLEYCKNKPRYYSEYPIQQDDKVEILCGHYCIYVLYKLYNGYHFKNILHELMKCGRLSNIF